MKSYIFWDITMYNPLKVNQCLEEYVASIFKVEEQTTKRTGMKQAASYPLHSGFLLSLFFDPKDGGNMFL
jgi:hypothetical protein